MSHTYIRVSRGKDLAINWPVLVNNQPADLTGLDLSLVRYEPNGKEVSMQFTIENGVIATVFRGRHQTQLGNYRFRLWANRKQNGETHYDFPELFTLVRWEWEENIPQGSGVNVVTLNLSTGNILIGAAGRDADIEAAERAATRANEAAAKAENNIADVASLKGSVVAADTLNDKTLQNLLLGHVALNAQKALIFRITKGSLIGKIILVNKINSEIVYTYLPFMSRGDFAYINTEIGCQDLDVILESGMVMQDTEYEIIVSGASVDAINFLALYLDRKVDKENGKGLSTNDFTNELKSKLETLKNYDDAEVRELVSKVQDSLDTLTGKEDTTDVIDTFNGIIAFLNSFKDDDSLASILNTLKSELEGKLSQLDSKVGELDGKKVNKEEGKGLSTNDYTNAEKAKLEGLENYDDTKLREEVEGKQDKLTEEQMRNINADHAKFAEKTELNKVEENVNDLNELNYVYGVVIDETLSSPSLQRVGNLELHKSLPVQSLMKRCLLLDDGTVNYYLDANNSLLKEDGTEATLDGTDGMVMVEMPRHYRRLKMLSESSYRVDISLYPFNGAIEIPQMYVSAWEATVDRNNGNMLSSVVNNTARYRGGNNQSAWDDTYRSVLGKPATDISLTNFRNYARKRGEGWNCYEYRAHLVLFWMYTIEYATLHSQKAFNAELSAEGYKQGGMGAGVTNINSTKWNTYNSYYPICPCGYTASLGNKTGVLPFSFDEEQQEAYGDTYSDNVPSYRGIENPFGHIFKWTDGVMFDIRADSDSGESFAFKVADANDYGNISKQIPFGMIPRVNGYVKNAILTEDGDIIPRLIGGGSTTYFCDYFYTSLPMIGCPFLGLLLGGYAYSGPTAGLAYSISNNAASVTHATFGSRLCFCRTSKL